MYYIALNKDNIINIVEKTNDTDMVLGTFDNTIDAHEKVGVLMEAWQKKGWVISGSVKRVIAFITALKNNR